MLGKPFWALAPVLLLVLGLAASSAWASCHEKQNRLPYRRQHGRTVRGQGVVQPLLELEARQVPVLRKWQR